MSLIYSLADLFYKNLSKLLSADNPLLNEPPEELCHRLKLFWNLRNTLIRPKMHKFYLVLSTHDWICSEKVSVTVSRRM